VVEFNKTGGDDDVVLFVEEEGGVPKFNTTYVSMVVTLGLQDTWTNS
jgi:hypothetical protein